MGQLVAPLAAQEEELSLALALGGAPAPALLGPAAVVQEELGAPALAMVMEVRVPGARNPSRGDRVWAPSNTFQHTTGRTNCVSMVT